MPAVPTDRAPPPALRRRRDPSGPRPTTPCAQHAEAAGVLHRGQRRGAGDAERAHGTASKATRVAGAKRGRRLGGGIEVAEIGVADDVPAGRDRGRRDRGLARREEHRPGGHAGAHRGAPRHVERLGVEAAVDKARRKAGREDADVATALCRAMKAANAKPQERRRPRRGPRRRRSTGMRVAWPRRPSRRVPRVGRQAAAARRATAIGARSPRDRSRSSTETRFGVISSTPSGGALGKPRGKADRGPVRRLVEPVAEPHQKGAVAQRHEPRLEIGHGNRVQDGTGDICAGKRLLEQRASPSAAARNPEQRLNICARAARAEARRRLLTRHSGPLHRTEPRTAANAPAPTRCQ